MTLIHEGDKYENASGVWKKTCECDSKAFVNQTHMRVIGNMIQSKFSTVPTCVSCWGVWSLVNKKG